MKKITLKKYLIDLKENKESTTIRKNLLKKRLNYVCESTMAKYQTKMTKNKKNELLFKFVSEINNMQKSKLLKEDLGDIFKSIFGETAFGGVFKELYSSLISSILGRMGVSDEQLKENILNYSSEDTTRLLNSLNSCEELTRLLSEAIIQSFIIKTEKEETNVVFSKIKEILSLELKRDDIVKKLEDSLKSTVCEFFEKYTEKANNVLNILKGMKSSSPEDIQIQ